MIVNNYNDRPNNLFKFDIPTFNNANYNEEIVEDSKELKDYSIYSFVEEDNEDEFIEQEEQPFYSQLDFKLKENKEKEICEEDQFLNSTSNNYNKYGQVFSDYKWNSFVAIPYGLARGLLIENETNPIIPENACFSPEKAAEHAAKIASYVLYRTRYNKEHQAIICRKDIHHALKLNTGAINYGLKTLKNAGIINTSRKGNINGTNSIILNEERMKEIENKGTELEKKDNQEYYKERSKTVTESIQRVINYQRRIKYIDENKYSF